MPLPRNLKLDADQRYRLGGQLLRLSKRYDRALSERLSRWNLSPTHYEILKLLYGAPDYAMTHSSLAEALGVTLPSITLAVRKLGALKLIGSQRGADRRIRIITLSVKGAETLAALYDATEAFTEALFTAITEKGARTLEHAIQRLLARLAELDDDSRAMAA